jgi:hypothetical protein
MCQWHNSFVFFTQGRIPPVYSYNGHDRKTPAKGNENLSTAFVFFLPFFHLRASGVWPNIQ